MNAPEKAKLPFSGASGKSKFLSVVGLSGLLPALLSAPDSVQSALIRSTSLYTPQGLDLVWPANPGSIDEPQTSLDFVSWKRLHRDFPTTAPLSTGVTIVRNENARFYRVLRWPGRDTVPPREVTNLNLAAAPGTQTLSWTDSADTDVVFHEVFPEGADGTFHIVPKGTGYFLLRNPGGKGATIRAVDDSGNRSAGLFIKISEPTAEIPNLKLIVSPSGANVGRIGATTIVARVEPVPAHPLRFEWTTAGKFGTLNGKPPGFPPRVDEVTASGSVQVLYSAHLLANPGGQEKIFVRVFDEDEKTDELVEAEVFVDVDPPLPQNADFRSFETTEPGTTAGRLTTRFGTAWVFKKVPGFSTYIFTLLRPPGEGTSYGPVGVELPVGSSLRNATFFINTYGGNLIGMTEDELAWVAYGSGSSNYNPNNAASINNLEQQRQANLRVGQAAFSVMPRLKSR